jgi:hypothetical protein
MNTPENPPAFPRPDFHSDRYYISPAQEGMTLRDWFAGHALIAAGSILANKDANPAEAQLVASDCYRIADAMLAEREAAEAPRHLP